MMSRTAPATRPNGAAKKTFTRSRGIVRRAWKVGIYGPEGVGKSSLMAACPGIVVADLEHSTMDLDVERVEGIENWSDLRAWVQGVTPEEYPTIGIDSMTRAEDWCVDYVIKNKASNEGVRAVDSIEDFKYRAGLTFVCDEFRRFLGDIENAFLRGVNVVMIAHNFVNRVKNPDGSDYIRMEPRLINADKGSNMLQWVQFLDHLAYIGFDVVVNKGKATGGSSRTIYLEATANRMAKTRSLPIEPIVFDKGNQALWDQLNNKPAASELPPM
jgi:hypothetical protein